MKWSILALAVLLAPAFALAGSQTFSAPGTYTFTVPAYETLTVRVSGAGGGGGGGGCRAKSVIVGRDGSPGASSSFNGSLVAYGGQQGIGSVSPTNNYAAGPGSDGAPGSGTGGDVQIGGGSPGGDAGYAATWYTSNCWYGGKGGYGGLTVRTYRRGEIAPGSSVSVVVGSAGPGGVTGTGLWTAYPGQPSPVWTVEAGGNGTDGSVTIDWADALPSCAISFDTNPIAYGSGTLLRWSSSDTSWMYIANVGYVSGSGSVWIQPSQTTAYSGTAGNDAGSVVCSGTQTLTVNPPGAPSVSIWADADSIAVGQSLDIHATFVAGSDDALAGDNIDMPLGTGLGATTNPDARKDITFTPTAAGTYTFYARATTQYFPSWTTYGTVSVTVSSCANGLSIQQYPSCSCPAGQVQSGSVCIDECQPAYSCSGSSILYTNAQCETSTVMACTEPAFCSAGASACLYPPLSFEPFGDSLAGHLQVRPVLVRFGDTSKVYWNVANASSCTVSGDNGDIWTGPSSGTEGRDTSRMTQMTTYILNCTGLDRSQISETATVLIAPIWGEN